VSIRFIRLSTNLNVRDLLLGLRGRIGTELQELQPSNNKSPQTKEVEMKEKQKRHGQVMVQTKEVEMKEK
jgi:hypothetical protein